MHYCTSYDPDKFRRTHGRTDIHRTKIVTTMSRLPAKRLLNQYCEIFGTRSFGGDALASSCVLCHMNSCRIFHNINSITYNYLCTLISQYNSFHGVIDYCFILHIDLSEWIHIKLFSINLPCLYFYVTIYFGYF